MVAVVGLLSSPKVGIFTSKHSLHSSTTAEKAIRKVQCCPSRIPGRSCAAAGIQLPISQTFCQVLTQKALSHNLFLQYMRAWSLSGRNWKWFSSITKPFHALEIVGCCNFVGNRPNASMLWCLRRWFREDCVECRQGQLQSAGHAPGSRGKQRIDWHICVCNRRPGLNQRRSIHRKRRQFWRWWC